MFRKRQNSLSRYFASEDKIAIEDVLPQEAEIEKSANFFAGHVRTGLKKNKCPRSTGGYGLDVAGYGRSGPEKSWNVPSLAYGGHLYLECALCDVTIWSSCFQTNVLAKVVDIIGIFFYTHFPNFMCHCTEYQLSALQVRILEENILNAKTQQFVTAKQKYQAAR